MAKSDSPTQPVGGEVGGSLYAWTVVAILCLAYTVSFIDRMIINLLVGPIKADLQISDTQMSFLQGFSFAIFYTLMGLPIARLADRANRKRIMIIGVSFWSLLTAACGLARNYWTLFLARMGVGVGEAALSPAAYSMIADYFPPQRVGRAISVYSMGLSFGAGLAFIVGGAVVGSLSGMGSVALPLIGEVRPWQLTFLVVALPGIVVVLLMSLIREPARRELHGHVGSEQYSGFMQFFSRHRRAVLSHLLGFSFLTIVSHGSLAWLPTYFIRVHGFSVSDAGMVLGLASILCGAPGYFAAAWLAERLEKKGYPDAIFRVVILCALAMVPTIWLLALAQGIWLYVTAAIFTFLISTPWGVAAAAVQLIAPNRLRAQLSALYLFSINLIGLGLGPTLVALLTDYYFHDEMAVGKSMALACSAALVVAALTLIWGRKAYGRSVTSLAAGG